MITRKVIRDLSEWYDDLEDADDAISPLIGFLAMACIDAGYDKEGALKMFFVGWDAVERILKKEAE